MAVKNCISNIFLGLFITLCITKVCQGELMCYICDDCEKVTLQTPIFECNEKFFDGDGPTSTTIQTTTESDATSVSADTTTPELTTKLSTEYTTESTTVTESDTTITTEDTPPTPPTEGPPTTAPPLPTPPTPDFPEPTNTTEDIPSTTTTVKPDSLPPTTITEDTPTIPPSTTSAKPDTLQPLDDVEHLNNRNAAHDQNVNKDEVETVDAEQGITKPYKPSAEFRVRQLRSVSDVSYHCIKVKATTANGTLVVNRGCSRVSTNESVCNQWESQHPNEKLDKCFPCSRTKCNSSSALSVSMTALLMTAVAVFLQRK